MRTAVLLIIADATLRSPGLPELTEQATGRGSGPLRGSQGLPVPLGLYCTLDLPVPVPL